MLATATGGFWDRANTVDVFMIEGSLESKSALEVLNGSNIAYLGGEIIGYQTATLTDTNTYTPSNLLRGLRNTESFMGTHVAAEAFCSPRWVDRV